MESISAEKITLAINNKNNPFKGKKLVKGTQIRYEDGNIGTITKVTDKEVFLRVENKSNPFYGKKLVVGLTGIYEESQRVTITKIEGKNITLKIEEKNPNPLVNKTLIFDLTLRSVTAAKK